MEKIGSRVVAVAKADEKQIFIYGRGIYEGLFPHPYVDPYTAEDVKAALEMSGATKEEIEKIPEEELTVAAERYNTMFSVNPKIKLDSGQVVWGCECWWGPEEAFDENFVNGRDIQEIDIDVDRVKYGKEPIAEA